MLPLNTFKSRIEPLTIFAHAKKKLHNIYTIADNIGRLGYLPVILFHEKFKKPEDKLKEAETTKELAIHECGHVLTDILNGDIVVEAWVANFSHRIASTLGLPGGYVATEDESILSRTTIGRNIKQIFSSKKEDETTALKQTDLEKTVKEILTSLGGPASNHVFKHDPARWEKTAVVDRVKTASQINEYTDDEVMKKKILQLIVSSDKIHARQGQEAGLIDIFTIFFDHLTEFYRTPAIRNILTIFSEYLLESGRIKNKKSKGGINKLMLNRLQEKGVTEAEFKQIGLGYNKLVQDLTFELRGYLYSTN